jgi:SAM-dependent methyltransferase
VTMGMWTQIARDNAKALLPFQGSLRALKRAITPYRSEPWNDALALSQGLRIVRALREAGADLTGASVLEVGTGWIPTIPALFHLAGAGRIIGTDVERLLDGATTAHARRVVAAETPRVREDLGLPESVDVEASLETMKIDYRCPFDPRSVPDGSLDVIYSRAVLEHVRLPDLDSIFAGAHRMLRPGGFMAHLIDNSDHFQHRDRRLGRVNFLRYGDMTWRLMCMNVQNYQNRLRHTDYAARLVADGFEIVATEGEPDSECLRSLETLPLAPAFAGRPRDDLAILTSLFVARRPAH